jgi:hypothetical protein
LKPQIQPLAGNNDVIEQLEVLEDAARNFRSSILEPKSEDIHNFILLLEKIKLLLKSIEDVRRNY